MDNRKKNKKEQGIVKHNNFIQCKYSVKVNEQKFLYKLFQYVQKNNITTTNLSLDFDDFFSDYKSVINKNITRKDFLKLILSVQSNIPTIVRRYDNKFIKAAWFKIVGDLNFEKIELILDNDIYDYIKQQEEGEFTIISDSIYSLNTFYAMRIYELLKRWLEFCIRSNKPFVQDFKQLKEILMLDDTSRYKLYKVFNSRILKPSIELINENTDIYVTYNSVKSKTRSIEAIEFMIKPNPNFQQINVLDEPKNSNKDEKVDEEKKKLLEEKKKREEEIANLYIPVPNILNDRYNKQFKEFAWQNVIQFSEDELDKQSIIFRKAENIFIDNKEIDKVKNIANYNYFLGIFKNLLKDDINKFVKNMYS
ncbi:replication initiation protein (plasmid) [Clostridium perfringens]|uniref:replication initiation protein n=1 Tax=Clostridium perfringens TaxID=1502 RepID=UPI000B373895|nr:replication initiation protein [Clostridium perfringens]EGT0694230.1 replication initiation protein [Clostridium perfringens]OUN51876.1 hypothetical protein B5G18_11535 [Clostridium perfringens]OUP46243.1 hypothetical protein B5F20_09745 [Clostridium perfringens]